MFGSDISQILRRELSARITRNPNYSLRAFARDLEMGAPTLSRILNGERGISASTAKRIAKKLNLSADETEYFRNLADAQYARGQAVRSAAQNKLSFIAETFTHIDTEAFSIVSEWQHFAILALLETEGAKSDPVWVSNRLGITPLQTEEAIQRLLRNGMLKQETKKLVVTGSFFAESKKIPSNAIRQFHDQILTKAAHANHEQTMRERDCSTLLMAVDESDFDEAIRWIKKFREDFDQRFSVQAKRKNKVMALGIQFHTISKKEGHAK